mgnify:CR=1 FL=1
MDTPKENAYDTHIAPLMSQIIAACKEHKINMFASYMLDDHGEDGMLKCTTAIPVADPDDKEGGELVEKLRRTAKPPGPSFFAMTIICGPREPSS